MQARNRAYRYLDDVSDRRLLVADIRRVRQSVLQLAQAVPEPRRYEPRYGGWSLAALLAHLSISDRLALVGMQWALVGVRLPVPSALGVAVSGLTARAFQSRLTDATIRNLRGHERRIVEFILRLPMDRFTRQVYDPTSETYLTVERALQVAFLFHWQEHLALMQRVEGLFYEGPERY